MTALVYGTLAELGISEPPGLSLDCTTSAASFRIFGTCVALNAARRQCFSHILLQKLAPAWFFTQISLDLEFAIFVKSAVFCGRKSKRYGKDSNLSHTDDASDSFDHRKTCLGGNIVQIEDKVGVFTFALILHMCDVDPLRRDDGEDLG